MGTFMNQITAKIAAKKSRFFVLAAFVTSFASFDAQALVEARLTYGLLGSQPNLAALYSGAPASLPTVTPTYGIGADLLISPPLMSWGAGVRYENMGVSATSGATEFKADYTRTALLLNYRIIDTLLFLGPIASYGLSHSGNIKALQSGTETSNWSSTSISSYSIGLEAGVKLIGFRLGAEAGYEDFRWKGATDSLGSVATAQDINMSGTYAKILVGFGI
jgi:hypothetical protein